jgi:3'-5' exoribonuclease
VSGPQLFAVPEEGPRPFAFCGGPWPLIESLADGDDVTAAYVVHECRRSDTKSGKPYLRLLLGDRSGTIQAMVWDDAERLEPVCAAESVVGVRARVGSWQDQLQLTLQSVEPLRAGPGDMEYLFPSSPRPREAMEKELEALVATVADPALKKLLRRCVGKGTELGRAFRVHPAAKRNHHAYLCGLLEHSLSVATAADRLAGHYRATGMRLDRDLLVTGALLHDIGKIRELKGYPSIGYTTEGQLLGHIVIGIQLVTKEAAAVPELPAERLLLLQHLIASHQGKPEWDSPKVPQLLEALILHYADDLDAKLNQAGSLLAGVESGGWSSYDRNFARSFFRPPPSMPRTAEVEPVPAEEAVELLMDLFRG